MCDRPVKTLGGKGIPSPYFSLNKRGPCSTALHNPTTNLATFSTHHTVWPKTLASDVSLT